MDIPKQLLSDLVKLTISSYEWKVLLVILWRQYENRDNAMVEITLDQLVEATGIAKPHVSRAVGHLTEKNIIQRFTYKQVAVYQVHWQPEDWMSSLDGSDIATITKKTNDAFEAWISGYPNPMHAEDARKLYARLIQTREATTKDLADALRGYIRYEETRASKFRRDPDAWMCMYPTSFLRGNKWRDYLQFKDYEEPPDL